MRFYQKFLEILFYIGINFEGNQTLEKLCDKVQKLLGENCINFLVDLRFFFLFYLKLFYYFPALFRIFLSIINRIALLVFRFFRGENFYYINYYCMCKVLLILLILYKTTQTYQRINQVSCRLLYLSF